MCHQCASRSRTRFRPTLLPLLVRVLPFITHYCFYFFLFSQLWWRFSTSQRWPRRPYAVWSHASLPTVAIPTEGHAPLSEELGGISGKKSIFPPPIDVDVVFCVCKFPTSHLWSAARSFFYFRKTDERVCVCVCPTLLTINFKLVYQLYYLKGGENRNWFLIPYFGSKSGTYSSRTESAIGRAGVAALRSRVRPSAGPLEQRFRCLFFSKVSPYFPLSSRPAADEDATQVLHLRTKFRNPAGKKITSPHARTHNIHRNGPAETVGENSRRRRNSFFLSFPKKTTNAKTQLDSSLENSFCQFFNFDSSDSL